MVKHKSEAAAVESDFLLQCEEDTHLYDAASTPAAGYVHRLERQDGAAAVCQSKACVNTEPSSTRTPPNILTQCRIKQAPWRLVYALQHHEDNVSFKEHLQGLGGKAEAQNKTQGKEKRPFFSSRSKWRSSVSHSQLSVVPARTVGLPP